MTLVIQKGRPSLGLVYWGVHFVLQSSVTHDLGWPTGYSDHHMHSGNAATKVECGNAMRLRLRNDKWRTSRGWDLRRCYIHKNPCLVIKKKKKKTLPCLNMNIIVCFSWLGNHIVSVLLRVSLFTTIPYPGPHLLKSQTLSSRTSCPQHPPLAPSGPPLLHISGCIL